MLKILIIEDDDIAVFDLKMQLTLLKSLYHLSRVWVASDGKTALHYLHKQHYDVVFTDIHLPDMMGTDIIPIIRQAERVRNRRTKIIAVSANITPEIKRACWLAKADGIFPKPLSYETVKKILSKQFKTRSLLYPRDRGKSKV